MGVGSLNVERLAGDSKLVDRGAIRRAFTLLALGGAIAVLTATGVPLCPMAGVLGVPCPGCGLTRATLALLHGDFATALHFHPLVFVIAPVFAWVAGSAALGYVRGPRPQPNLKPWLATRTATVLAFTLLAATLLVWALRFAGYLGGPAPVETFHHWALALRH